MYISIGPEKTVKTDDVIGVFDLDTANSTKATKEFLKKAEKNKMTEMTGDEIPKSFVLMKDGKVYFSQFAAKIIKRRAENGNIK